MNWLLITNDSDRAEKLKNLISISFKSCSEIKISGGFFNIREMAQKLYGVTNCIIAEMCASETLSFMAGFMCGKNIAVYTVSGDSELDGRRECSDSASETCPVDNFHNFNSFDELCCFLRENKKEICADESRRTAFSYLFENGLPFTADNFACHIIRNDFDICGYYIRAGMDVNGRDSDGTPFLNIACRNENYEMTQLLLEKGADIDSVSSDRGYTPLMDAVWKGNMKISELLIKKGADVNKVNKEGQTMIVLAVGADRTDLCRLLCDNGADVDIPDAMGMSAYGYAKLFKKDKLIDILEKYHKE